MWRCRWRCSLRPGRRGHACRHRCDRRRGHCGGTQAPCTVAADVGHSCSFDRLAAWLLLAARATRRCGGSGCGCSGGNRLRWCRGCITSCCHWGPHTALRPGCGRARLAGSDSTRGGGSGAGRRWSAAPRRPRSPQRWPGCWLSTSPLLLQS